MRRRRASAVACAIAFAAILLALAAGPFDLGATGVALAADASPTPQAVGDPRSSGEGAGLVGSPFLAVGGMLAVGILAASGTLLYVRLTGGRREG